MICSDPQSVSCFSIPQSRYNISCKLYAPSSEVPHLAVLGVHGFGGDKESSALQALGNVLTAHGGALLCFDFPAHGASNAADTQLSVEHCKLDLLAAYACLRERFPKAPTGLFATSFGGYVSLLSLSALQPMPARLVLRAPAVQMAKTFRTRILRDGFAEYETKRSVSCGFERKMRVPYSFYRELQANNAASVIPAVPTLLLRAGADELIEPDDLSAFAKNAPLIQLVDIAGAGHRFKEPGALDRVIDAAAEWLLQAASDCAGSEKAALFPLGIQR